MLVLGIGVWQGLHDLVKVEGCDDSVGDFLRDQRLIYKLNSAARVEHHVKMMLHLLVGCFVDN